ncbi:putative dienelactone hydrolase [Streptomyces griseochromogenes]|uniref:Acetylhydrolase n=1 Tax=Streptomyces griseochromogenes TaxID=68214 RepID=A0A1B1BAV8_9ACTN|nr:acetylhydrolase [Streptomyces griseochromogenes]ANP55965.1 acetylhydrolase [Streptomyces griseochromogenes]MBP2051191.1 putative dienelactone hydrolase [Streptomyces griseochromogenes]
MTTTPFMNREGMTRRRTLAAALAVGAAVPMGVARPARAASTAPGPVRLTLPAPTGPYPVGTVPLHLVDTSRPDPVAGPGHHRELMAAVWYPARAVERYPLAPWASPAVARALLTAADFPADVTVAPLTAAHEGAPVLRTGRRLPVVVFSHGAHDHRADTTIVVQELASHGYAVVTVDHTYDAFSVFPDGRLTVPLDQPALTPRDFATDIRFVLDRVEDLAAGRNPDAGHRPPPTGLLGALDPRRIGMFGWSKGATATAFVMSEDRRVRAGLSFDGPMQPMITTDLDRPFMLMTAENSRAAQPSVAEFWDRLRGWRLNVHAEGAVHSSYCDVQFLIPQLAQALGMSDADLRGWIGTLDPTRAVRIQQAYPLAFFDLHLRHRGQGHLLDGPCPAFPEVKFIP